MWSIWTRGDDVYVASRSTAADMYASLHSLGKWRHAFTERHATGTSPFISPERDRAFDKWDRPPEFLPGWTYAYRIIVPASEVTPLKNTEAISAAVTWFPTPEPLHQRDFSLLLERRRKLQRVESGRARIPWVPNLSGGTNSSPGRSHGS